MLLDADFRFINEEFYADRVTPAQLDRLLADGWRHFGEHFFRYNLGVFHDEIRHVLPLRVRLAEFTLSKSQRKNLRKNADLTTSISPVDITPEVTALFDIHKQRFERDQPDTIYDFLSPDVDSPLPAMQLTVRENGLLVAVSFFEMGETSISSIYGMFNPTRAARGLGIFTMLKEIEFASSRGIELYYHGYAYEGESFYDYKKRFSALESFDWKGAWRPLAR